MEFIQSNLHQYNDDVEYTPKRSQQAINFRVVPTPTREEARMGIVYMLTEQGCSRSEIEELLIISGASSSEGVSDWFKEI